MMFHLPPLLPILGASVAAAGSFILRDGLRLLSLVRAVEGEVRPTITHGDPMIFSTALTKGAIPMALLDLLPSGVKNFIQSPEGRDDIRLAQALAAGDATAATAAVKAALTDAEIPEPYNSIVDLVAASDQFDALIANKLLEEVEIIKHAITG